MSIIKTLEQERAKLCLICVERIKLLKEGKWRELFEEIIKDFLPENYNEFKKFENLDGAKKEAFNKFKSFKNEDENKSKSEEEVYKEFRLKEFKSFDYKDYSSHAKRLPQMIISNGLIPTLAFYKSKGKDRGQIYQDISEVLETVSFKPYVEWKKQNQNKGLLEFLLDTASHTLRLTTTEVFSITNWLKRMAEIELGEKE